MEIEGDSLSRTLRFRSRAHFGLLCTLPRSVDGGRTKMRSGTSLFKCRPGSSKIAMHELWAHQKNFRTGPGCRNNLLEAMVIGRRARRRSAPPGAGSVARSSMHAPPSPRSFDEAE